MRALLTLLFALTAAAHAEARVVGYAVVIGNNAPPADSAGEGLATLRYAADDAVRFYALLSQFAHTTLLSTLDDATQKRHAKVAGGARVPSLETLRQVFASLGNDMRLDREAGNEPVLYSISNPRAVPLVLAEAPRSDRRAPIVKLQDLRRSFLLQGNVGRWGRFSIELDDGTRLLDAHMSGERAVTVALPVGAEVYVRTADGEARVSSSGKTVAVNDLRLAAPTVAARGGVDADYRQNLFASPYGPTYSPRRRTRPSRWRSVRRCHTWSSTRSPMASCTRMPGSRCGWSSSRTRRYTSRAEPARRCPARSKASAIHRPPRSS